MLAGFAHNPALELSKDEAKAIAEASTNVARHYNAVLDPKIADWVVLLGTLGAIYGPRVFMLVGKKKPKAAQQQSEPLAPINHEQAQQDAYLSNLPTIGNTSHLN
jgi:hypothetical protein